ncbi:PREDICTED: C-C chemokine receptor type 5-like [Branchiostoma belcheri]|uniref:C-C chemokine receptor type 5-like n=1 Tax=Branchiostoma belcheri TaxID=7741 RepID=A0A6P4YI07_BRABE|nr:PREDICTED: C-C chemokine receptor type 5-like [Branchiostoma belcheri]
MNFSNESFVTNASTPTPSPESLPAEPAFIVTVAVLAIVGNILVIAVTTRRQTFPSSSRLFISSMAFSDLLDGLTFPFMVAPAAAGEWNYSGTVLRTTAVIGVSSALITYSALAGLNLDRYYALMNGGEGMPSKKACIFLISDWVGIFAFNIFSVVYGLPAAAHNYINVQNPNPQQPPVAPNHFNDNSYAKVVLILTLVQTTLPLPTLGVLIASWLGHVLPTALFWSSWIALSNTFLDLVVYNVCQQSFRKVVVEMARCTSLVADVEVVRREFTAYMRENRKVLIERTKEHGGCDTETMRREARDRARAIKEAFCTKVDEEYRMFDEACASLSRASSLSSIADSVSVSGSGTFI